MSTFKLSDKLILIGHFSKAAFCLWHFSKAAFCLQQKIRKDFPENVTFLRLQTCIFWIFTLSISVYVAIQHYSKVSYVSAKKHSWLHCGLSHMQLLNSHYFKTLAFLTVYHTGSTIWQKLQSFAVSRNLQNAKKWYFKAKRYKNTKINDTTPNSVSNSTWLCVTSNMKSSSHKT